MNDTVPFLTSLSFDDTSFFFATIACLFFARALDLPPPVGAAGFSLTSPRTSAKIDSNDKPASPYPSESESPPSSSSSCSSSSSSSLSLPNLSRILSSKQGPSSLSSISTSSDSEASISSSSSSKPSTLPLFLVCPFLSSTSSSSSSLSHASSSPSSPSSSLLSISTSSISSSRASSASNNPFARGILRLTCFTNKSLAVCVIASASSRSDFDAFSDTSPAFLAFLASRTAAKTSSLGGSEGGGAKYGILPRCQSNKMDFATEFKSGSPPFNSLP
mmetsp:Transcript_4881/g.14535  ORF Transcript_4881/g.14535 Transcript_4881/m.14535 type:complete len:275 (-) Transcript_4881:565-1389(-)